MGEKDLYDSSEKVTTSFPMEEGWNVNFIDYGCPTDGKSRTSLETYAQNKWNEIITLIATKNPRNSENFTDLICTHIDKFKDPLEGDIIIGDIIIIVEDLHREDSDENIKRLHYLYKGNMFWIDDEKKGAVEQDSQSILQSYVDTVSAAMATRGFEHPLPKTSS